MSGLSCRSVFAGLLIASMAQQAAAQAPPVPALAGNPDRTSASLFDRRDLLIGGGVLAVTGLLMPLDRGITMGFQSDGPQRSAFLHHSAKVLNTFGDPGGTVFSLGLWGAGLLTGSRTMTDVGSHASIAIASSGLITAFIKGVAGRQRPRVDPLDSDEFAVGAGFAGGRTSFPSGHTTAAFAFATVMSAELGRLAPGPARFLRPLLYLSAAGVGLARIYDSKHWASDVVLGAGIGTFTGMAVTRIAHRTETREAGARLDGVDLLPSVGIVPGGVGLAWSLPLH